LEVAEFDSVYSYVYPPSLGLNVIFNLTEGATSVGGMGQDWAKVDWTKKAAVRAIRFVIFILNLLGAFFIFSLEHASDPGLGLRLNYRMAIQGRNKNKDRHLTLPR
jgi:hypothetical protein